MERKLIFMVAMIMLLSPIKTWASVSEVKNGSFEDDNRIYNIITNEPNCWDVNCPVNDVAAAKFGGWVDNVGPPTDGSWNLIVFNEPSAEFDPNDVNDSMLRLSQEVCLFEANTINFDVMIETYSGDPWDHNMCTAVLLIDDAIVWDSNNLPAESYLPQTVVIGADDRAPHILTLGLKANRQYIPDYYFAYWDAVQFDGYLVGDFDRDGDVDARDFAMLANRWKREVQLYDKYNLYNGDDFGVRGIINFKDFSVFATGWDGDMQALREFVELWLFKVEPDNPNNLFGEDDEEPKGIINSFDLMIFAENWAQRK